MKKFALNLKRGKNTKASIEAAATAAARAREEEREKESPSLDFGRNHQNWMADYDNLCDKTFCQQGVVLTSRDTGIGRIIFSLADLPLSTDVWLTEAGTPVQRVTPTEVLIGDEKTVVEFNVEWQSAEPIDVASAPVRQSTSRVDASAGNVRGLWERLVGQIDDASDDGGGEITVGDVNDAMGELNEAWAAMRTALDGLAAHEATLDGGGDAGTAGADGDDEGAGLVTPSDEQRAVCAQVREEALAAAQAAVALVAECRERHELAAQSAKMLDGEREVPLADEIVLFSAASQLQDGGEEEASRSRQGTVGKLLTLVTRSRKASAANVNRVDEGEETGKRKKRKAKAKKKKKEEDVVVEEEKE